jgi:hypothetical protein
MGDQGLALICMFRSIASLDPLISLPLFPFPLRPLYSLCPRIPLPPARLLRRAVEMIGPKVRYTLLVIMVLPIGIQVLQQVILPIGSRKVKLKNECFN